MSDIFLSYRRDDEPGYVGRLADGLVKAFGDVVYRDVDSVRGGSKWKLELQKEVSQAQVVIAIIGRRWESILTERDAESDYVRFELNLANMLEIPVIPVRIQDARVDSEQNLGDLNWLRDRQIFEMSDVQDRWTADLEKLVELIAESTRLELVRHADRPPPESPAQSISQQTSHGAQSPNIQSDGGDVTISFNEKNDQE